MHQDRIFEKRHAYRAIGSIGESDSRAGQCGINNQSRKKKKRDDSVHHMANLNSKSSDARVTN